MTETVLTYTYNEEDGGYRVSGYTSIQDDGIVIIPDTYNDNSNGEYPVIDIGYSAFSYCTSLTSITIPDSVTSIGDYAFDSCTSLTSVIIGDSVIGIGEEAFYGCNALTSIIIPNSVTSIGYQAFCGCDGLTSVTIGNSVTTIGNSAFYGCDGLTSVTIGNSVTTIGDYVFSNCQKLKKVYYTGSKEKWDSYIAQSSDLANESIKVYNEIHDCDFLAFTFDGYHSLLDLNIIRTSEGDRYNTNLSPQMKDVVTEVPNGDGQYYFGTNYPSKQFSINFAFDSLTEQQLRKLKQIFAGDKISDLIFDEEPYKVYSAKATGTPTLKYIPFNDKNGQRTYKGEGTVQFTAYWPYAHTPNTTTKISKKFRKSGTFEKNGLLISQYDEWLYPTKEQWAPVSGIINTGAVNVGENYGDIPTPFILKYSTTIIEDLKFTVGSNYVIIRAKEYEAGNSAKPGPAFTDFKWDSKTGMVSARINGAANGVPISFEGTSCCTIPVGGEDTIKIEKWDSETEEWVNYLKVDSDGTWKQYVGNSWVAVPAINNILTLKYNYWYY